MEVSQVPPLGKTQHIPCITNFPNLDTVFSRLRWKILSETKMPSKGYHSFVYRKILIWHIVIFYLPQNCIQNWHDKIEFVHQFSLCIYRHDTTIVRMKILQYLSNQCLGMITAIPKLPNEGSLAPVHLCLW